MPEKFWENYLKVENQKPEENIILTDNPEFLAEKKLIIEETKENLNDLKNDLEVKKFLDSNPKYKENQDYLPIIDFCIENKLNFEVVLLILEASWNVIEERSDSEQVLTVVKTLKDNGLLDSAGIIFEETEDKKEEDNSTTKVSEKREKTDSLAEKVINIAKTKVWLVEWSSTLNKMIWFNTKKSPWCAAFINACLKEAWVKWSWSNLALSFVWLSGYWHAGIKDWNSMISWNWWNKVAKSAPMSNVAVWYALITENWLKKFPWNISYDKIPNWAIVCWRRNPRSWRWA